MKKSVYLLLLSFGYASLALAEDVSELCLQSMQQVYKFYYQEIIPKATVDSAQKLDDTETKHMETVITNLKQNCPPQLIAKMNLLLREEGQA